MKVIAFSDLHIHNYKRFATPEFRLNSSISVLPYLYNYAEKNGIEHILFSGDMFHQQVNIPVSVSYELKKVFKRLDNRDISFIAISGNHDQATKQVLGNQAVSALQELELLFNNFHLIDHSNYQISKDVCVHGIPYYEYKEHFSHALSTVEVDNTCKNILLMHQTPTHENSVIPVDIDVNDKRLGKFDLILNGHIHKREELTDKFINVGSTIQREREDAGVPKGFYVIDTETMEREFIEPSVFPKVVLVSEGMETNAMDYNIIIPVDIETVSNIVNIEKFESTEKHNILLENYCEEVDAKDKLQTGLKYI